MGTAKGTFSRAKMRWVSAKATCPLSFLPLPLCGPHEISILVFFFNDSLYIFNLRLLKGDDHLMSLGLWRICWSLLVRCWQLFTGGQSLATNLNGMFIWGEKNWSRMQWFSHDCNSIKGLDLTTKKKGKRKGSQTDEIARWMILILLVWIRFCWIK